MFDLKTNLAVLNAQNRQNIHTCMIIVSFTILSHLKCERHKMKSLIFYAK